MAAIAEVSATDHHKIECRGPKSYWVLRFKEGYGMARKSFSRVVYFARSKRDAEAYVSQREVDID